MSVTRPVAGGGGGERHGVGDVTCFFVVSGTGSGAEMLRGCGQCPGEDWDAGALIIISWNFPYRAVSAWNSRGGGGGGGGEEGGL